MSGLYASIRTKFATGALNWLTGNFDVALVSAAYGPNYMADVYVASVPPAAILAPFQPLSGLAVQAGWCKAANVVVPAFSSIVPITGVLIVQSNAGAQSTWELVALIDQGVGFGNDGNGIPVNINWNTNGCFRV